MPPEKDAAEGNGYRSLLICPNFTMANEPQIPVIENMINGLLADEPGYFLVQVRIKPTNNVKVFLDGDQGITIEKCIRINRKLYPLIEAGALFPDGDFSLEVSSPGLGEPLLLNRQYIKNIGRFVEVKLTDGSILEGELKAADENGIVVEVTTGKGKKTEIKQQVINFPDIKSTTIQIKF